ncbi:restriction endonuclease subunit S [Anaerospora hongkongensis]|uniref:restriction endonuclease subunit S n=1 Tax=Anaerospora hongkongensis TaxID=244830 RepID=UPI0028993A48|nr:restriction endonuclease subunit S [Anaerospora hongkongensis]
MSKWEMVRLGDVCEVTSSKRIFESEYTLKGIPFYRTKELVELSKGNEISTTLFISIERYNEIKEKFEVPNVSDILISAVGTIGTVWIVSGEDPFYFKDGNILWIKKSLYFEPKYLKFMLGIQIKNNIANITIGSAYDALTIIKLKNMLVPLPPLEVQKKLAQTLDAASELIALRKNQLEELDNLIKSTFHELFGDPVANEKGWDIKELGSIALKIGSGATPKGGKESYKTTGISLIRSMNVHNGAFKYDQLAHLDDEQASKLDNVEVKVEDVLINITGASVARSCIVPVDVLPARVNQHVSIVRISNEIANCYYINNVFISNSYQKNLLSIGSAGGATREAITKNQLQELAIPLPPLTLQNQFAEIVTKIEEQKSLVQKAIDESQYLFDSLMSEYFE